MTPQVRKISNFSSCLGQLNQHFIQMNYFLLMCLRRATDDASRAILGMARAREGAEPSHSLLLLFSPLSSSLICACLWFRSNYLQTWSMLQKLWTNITTSSVNWNQQRFVCEPKNTVGVLKNAFDDVFFSPKRAKHFWGNLKNVYQSHFPFKLII